MSARDQTPAGAAADQAGGAEQAAQVLGVLLNLVIDACSSGDQRELAFKILNSSIHLLHYDRALLWDLRRPQPRLLGVSGQPDTQRNSRLAKAIGNFVHALGTPLEAGPVGPRRLPGLEQDWEKYAQGQQGLAVMWLPFICGKRLVAALWLERWGQEATWSDDEVKVMQPLAEGYGAAWSRFAAREPLLERLRRKRLHLVAGALATVAIVYFAFIRTSPLRLVAPCEVVARDPYVVSAPLDGVIEKVLVEPGEQVQPGDPLFVYDQRASLQDLKVAEQKVREIQTELDRSVAMGFTDRQAQAQVAILRHRLAQERLRRDLARYVVASLRVKAEVAGIVMIKHPYEWRGKPVRMGERVLTIIDPARTKLRIWLAQNDNVGLRRDYPVDVFLLAMPRVNHRARIVYVSPDTSLAPSGLKAFLVEARWSRSSPEVRPGLKGSAVLYGPRCSIAYWLLRKPWSTIRRALAW